MFGKSGWNNARTATSKQDENKRHGKWRNSERDKRQHLKPSRNEDNISRNEIQQTKLKKALKRKLERTKKLELNSSLSIYYSVTHYISLAIHQIPLTNTPFDTEMQSGKKIRIT